MKEEYKIIKLNDEEMKALKLLLSETILLNKKDENNEDKIYRLNNTLRNILSILNYVER